MIKIHVLHTGKVSVDIGVPLKQKNPLAPTGFFRKKEDRVWLPVSVYLIEHPKGRILIDTGWHTEVRNKQVKRKFGFLPISFANLPEGQAVNEQLATLGYETSDIDYVFITHMDGDHIGGIKLVKDAKNIMVSEPEWNDSKKKRYFFRYKSASWDGVEIQTFQYAKSKLGPVGRSFDVFGDGTIQLVSTPGHSNGLFTALIKGEEDTVAIIGDTGYMEKSWEKMILPGLTVDKNAAKHSLEWVKKLSKEGVTILATHDPKVTPRTIIV